MKTFFFLVIIFVFSSCLHFPTCDEYRNKYKTIEKKIKIEKKYKEERFYVFIGTNNTGALDTLKLTGFIELYNNAEYGDLIKKDKEKTITYLIKNNRIIVYNFNCPGETTSLFYEIKNIKQIDSIKDFENQ